MYFFCKPFNLVYFFCKPLNFPDTIIMVRRYRKSGHKGSSHYSVEHTMLQSPNLSDWTTFEGDSDRHVSTSYQYPMSVIGPAAIEGKRTVKHLTISLQRIGLLSDENQYFAWALVFVPQGYQVQRLFFPTEGSAVSMYDANQFVLGSGVVDFNAGPARIRCPVSKSLNSGDDIVLIMAVNNNASEHFFMAQVSYAIKFN